MEHLLLQHLNVAAHEQHYFTPAPTSAFLATHQDLAVSSRGEQHLAAERASASRAAAARARLAQAAQVRAAQQTHLRRQEQNFTAWLAKMPLNTNADEVTLSPLPEQNEGASAHLQLKPELSAKLSTFPPKAAQITCACKCLRSHPIALVAPEQQALAHQRTRTEQLSCDYQALVLTYLKPAERPAFYNMCLSSVTALNGLTNHQLIEQAAAHYAPLTLRAWAHQFTGAPEDQLTRAWNLADLSHFECCDYELPQQPKAYDVKRTCLALSERAQCVTLEAQQAINDLSLSISRMQPRHLGSALTKINPLFQLDGVGFIQGLAELGRIIPQHYPLVPLMAPGITATDATNQAEQVKDYLKSTELKLKGKLRKQAECNDAQFQAELEQAQQQANALASKTDLHDPDDQGGSSGSNDSGSAPNDSGNMPDASGSSEDIAAASSTKKTADLGEHTWFVPVLPESPFGSARSTASDAVAPEDHDWFVPILPESPFGPARSTASDAVAPEDHSWFVPILPESPFGSARSSAPDAVAPEDHDWFVPILPESPFAPSPAPANVADLSDHSWFVPTLPVTDFGLSAAPKVNEDEVVKSYQQLDLVPIVPELCHLHQLPVEQPEKLPDVPFFLAEYAQLKRVDTHPERWEATFPQLYGDKTDYGYVDLVQPTLVNALDPKCWYGASAGALPHTFVLPQAISTRDAQGVPQALVLNLLTQDQATSATLLNTSSESDFVQLSDAGYLTLSCTQQVLEQFRCAWLNNNDGAGFSVSTDPSAPEYLDYSLDDCHGIGASPAELSGSCYEPLPYDTLRIEQMAVESTCATPAYPYGKVAQTGLAPYCNALSYLKEQHQQTGHRSDALKISMLEQQLRDTATHLRWYADRRLNFEYSCAMVNQDLAASGRQVNYDLHDCDWVANAAQFNFLMQARCAEGQVRQDLATLKSMCVGVPQFHAELDRHEGLGALYAEAQSKQLALGATAFDFSALPQLPHGKLPPFLTAAESCRLLQNRAH